MSSLVRKALCLPERDRVRVAFLSLCRSLKNTLFRMNIHNRFLSALGSVQVWQRLAVISLAALLVACGSTKSTPQGHYRVQRGDTLSKIARQHGQSVSELARTNGIRNPNKLEVGQLLKVRGGSAAPVGTGGGSMASAGSSSALPAPTASTNSVAAGRSINLVWPASGPARRGVRASHSQGVFIGGQTGAPVNAAAAGKVIYSGSGLRGYGNLLILSHDANFMSVYAHNSKLLVSEGQSVKQGQKIAEMGSSDTDRTQLYFELRYNGKPVDAMRYLPKR